MPAYLNVIYDLKMNKKLNGHCTNELPPKSWSPLGGISLEGILRLSATGYTTFGVVKGTGNGILLLLFRLGQGLRINGEFNGVR
jgi:hypothetical protein